MYECVCVCVCVLFLHRISCYCFKVLAHIFSNFRASIIINRNFNRIDIIRPFCHKLTSSIYSRECASKVLLRPIFPLHSFFMAFFCCCCCSFFSLVDSPFFFFFFFCSLYWQSKYWKSNWNWRVYGQYANRFWNSIKTDSMRLSMRSMDIV